MLEIICPTTYPAERYYILDLLLREFWGLEYRLSKSDKTKDKTLFRRGASTLIIHDGLFRTPNAVWLRKDSLPTIPLKQWNVAKDFSELSWILPCPVIYTAGILDYPVMIGADTIEFDVDILGTIFFMLTRYEEIVNTTRDRHGRFPAVASLAYRADFLGRPLANEYMEIMWAAMSRLFPDLRRKQRKFRLILTHDVDHPFGMMYESYAQVLRHLMGDLLRRKSLAAAIRRIQDVWDIIFHKDAYIDYKKETYSFLYQISRKYRLKDIFFFMNSRRSYLDGNYLVSEPEVQTLLREIHKEGHFVGLHPSYLSFEDKAEILKETVHANQLFQENGLPPVEGGRQHYLRWANPDTWQSYEDAGIPSDSSLGYADQVGFRCGICYEYPVFNLLSRCKLHLRERPLIVMDVTLTDYMHLSKTEAMKKVLTLARECMRYSGDFVVLWHNTTLNHQSNRVFYTEMIERIFLEYDGRERNNRSK